MASTGHEALPSNIPFEGIQPMKGVHTTLVAVSLATIRIAEKVIGACQGCERTADVSFSRVLDHVTGRDGAKTEYLLTEPAKCPRCSRSVFENTLIERN